MKVGREFNIPVRTSKPHLDANPEFRRHVPDDYIVVDSRPGHNVSVPAGRWNEAYDEYIRGFGPGLHEIVIHPGFHDEEMRATTINKVHWYESAWRQRDYDYVVSRRFRDLLREHNIRLITWQEIQNLMYPG